MHTDKRTVLRIWLEVAWWIFTAVLCFVVILPIWQTLPAFPFYGMNILFILIFVTFARYIFLLKHTFLARLTWLKVVLLAGSAILIFVLITTVGNFNNFVEEQGLESLTSHMPLQKQQSITHYIHTEMVFFGVGSVITAIIMPFRMLISIWRQRNTGKV